MIDRSPIRRATASCRRLFVAGAALAVLAPAAATFAPASASAQTLTEEHLSALDYREIGPTRQGGRFVDVAVHPEDDRIFYMATASGHLWKSDNRGITFDVLFEDQDVFSIGDIAIAPSDPDVIYLGSGEPNNSRSSYWGDGVYKSTDGGETWENVGLPESHHIGRVVVHPDDPDIVYVAALGHLYSENPERGLYKTTDGGETWQRVLEHTAEGKQIGVVDVAMNPLDPSILFATTFDKVRVPWSYDLGGPGSRVWRSTDAGETWEMLENGLPGGVLGRIGVDIYPRDPNIVYLTIENANKPDVSYEERLEELRTHQSSSGMIGGEVYRSNDGGDSWFKTHADSISIGGRPAYYYGQIRVDPNDPDRVFVLSISTAVSEDGGETWDTRGLGFGGDDHGLWIDPDDSDHMILGYDHGMGITYDGAENWYRPDFQSLAQFYAVGHDMSRPYRVAGGTQDNGSHMVRHTNPGGGPIYFEQWERVGGGDGMYNEIEPCTNRYLYNESQFGPIARTDLWTGDRTGIRYQDDELRWNWNSPILISPHDCDVIYHGSNRVLRSPFRGERWEVISPDLTKADPATLTTGKGGDGNIQYATITTIDESPLVEGLLWVGTDDGNVQVTRDGGETWTLLNDNIPNNPEYWVSRVEASNHHPGTAYVSYTGYRRDDFRPFVYKTTDYGATWTDISANLPDGPINVVREHHDNPAALFVGTEFQVFASIDGGGSWASMKLDMPTQPVHDMKIHPRENDLIVATHGRGMYIADISPFSELTPEVLASDAHFFEPESKVRWIADDRTNYATSNFRGESEEEEIPFYYWLGGMGQAGQEVTFQVLQGDLVIAELEAPSEPGMHRVAWEMEKRVERSAAEIEEMRERFESFGREVDEEDLRYSNEEAPLGDYRVVMRVDGRAVATHEVSILKDEWWMDRR